MKMTQEQVESLARTILKLAGGYALSKGWTDSQNIEMIIGGLLALLGAIMSHRNHAEPNVPETVKTEATKQ